MMTDNNSGIEKETIKLGYNTCANLKSRFKQLLQDNARQEWNTIKNTVAP